MIWHQGKFAQARGEKAALNEFNNLHRIRVKGAEAETGNNMNILSFSVLSYL